MATGNDPGGTKTDGKRRKDRPQTTIDLAATDVTAAGPAAAAAASHETSDPERDPAAATTGAAPESTAAAAPTSEDTAAPTAPSPETPDAAAADAAATAAATAGAHAGEPAAEPTAARSDDTPADGPERPVDPPSAPHAPVEVAPAARQASGGVSRFAAAAIGGLVVLAGGAGLLATGLFDRELPPAASPEEVAALQSRIADLTARLENTPAPQPVDLAPLERRLAAVEERPAPTDAGDALAALRADLDALSTRLGELAAAPAGPDPGPELAALRAGLDDLQAGLTEAGQQIAALRAAPPAVDPAEVEALAAASGTARERLDDLERRIGSLAETMATTGGAVDALRATLESARTEAAAAAEGIRGAVGELEARVTAIEERIDRGPKGGEIAALSLALTTLTTKLESGRPFGGDLDLLKAGAGDLDLSGLEAVADTGVATVDGLIESFPFEAIAAARPVDPNGGVLDRVLTGAKSLVNYRETGDQATDPLSRPLALAETALQARDLRAARTAVAELPEWARDVAAGWTARLDARIAAEDAAKALTDRLLARLQEPAEGR